MTTLPAHSNPKPFEARNARAEAQQLVAGQFDARVLEPSPPTVGTEPWFADDPTDPSDAHLPVVGPTSRAALTWETWLHDFPEQSAWAAERWLGAYTQLATPPPGLEATRLALHRLAVYVVSPARRRANGKIALRWTLGGFGTPFFGPDEQVRVVGASLVHQVGMGVRAAAITTLNDAAHRILGTPPDTQWAAEFDVPPAGDLDAPLVIDPLAAAWLGECYGFAYSVLEELRADPTSTDAGRVQLWPEHFDAAFECLPQDSSRRAGYGVSPGDAAHSEPYLYVVPWNFDQAPASALWDATTFRGAILPVSAILSAPDQRGAALEWFRARRDILAS